jgi:hypothetical protein
VIEGNKTTCGPPIIPAAAVLRDIVISSLLVAPDEELDKLVLQLGWGNPQDFGRLLQLALAAILALAVPRAAAHSPQSEKCDDDVRRWG